MGSVFHRGRKRGLPAIAISMSGNDNERSIVSGEGKGGEKVAKDTLRVSRSIGCGGGSGLEILRFAGRLDEDTPIWIQLQRKIRILYANTT